jgi:hypothetical protein
MKRTRGRSYPALSLREAVEKADQFYKIERNARVSPEVAVQAWNYKSLNGASSRVLSALRQYGLLDAVQSDVKISQRALAILLDEQHSEDYKEALIAASREPAAFADILDEYPDGLPSDTALISFLVRKREFNDEAARKITAVLRDTVDFVREMVRDLAPERSRAHIGGVEQETEDTALASPPARVEAPSLSRASGQVNMKYEFSLSRDTTATLLITGGELTSQHLALLKIFLAGAQQAIAGIVGEREDAGDSELER